MRPEDHNNEISRLEKLADEMMGKDDKQPEPRAVTVRASEVKPEKIDWLWPGRIPLGKLSIIAGDPGLGKSLVTTAIATHVTLGTPWPLDGGRCAPGGVLMLSAEDDPADTIIPRLLALGADLDRVHILQAMKRVGDDGREREGMFNLEQDVYELGLRIREIGGIKLLVIDPISAYLGGTDSHKNGEVRGLLAPLTDLAQRHRLAVLLVSHLNKGGGNAAYRVMGSLAFVAAPRSSYIVAKDPEDSLLRLVMPHKTNLAPEKAALAYRVGTMPTEYGDQPTLQWELAPENATADEVLSAQHMPGPEPDEKRKAEDWLRDLLTSGPRLQKEVLDEGVNGADLSKRTIERAKKYLRIESFRDEVPGPWWWRLPTATVINFPSHSKDAKSPPTPKYLGDLGGLVQKQSLTDTQECQQRQDRQDAGSKDKPGVLGVDGVIEQAISGLPITAAELLAELDPEDLDDIRTGDMQLANIRAVAESLLEHARQ